MNDQPENASIYSGIGSIFERIGDFFHIFDLSFFVAGVLTFGAFVFLYVELGLRREFPLQEWAGTVGVIVGCYICGIISFASGRVLNGFRATKLKQLMLAVRAHSIVLAPKCNYDSTDRKAHIRLYVRMWAEITYDAHPLVLKHLMRYWAIAATYDGVGFSFIVWALILFTLRLKDIAPVPLSDPIAYSGIILCLIAATIAFYQGAKYYGHQIEDVVAYFAVRSGKLVSDESLTLINEDVS